MDSSEKIYSCSGPICVQSTCLLKTQLLDFHHGLVSHLMSSGHEEFPNETA